MHADDCENDNFLFHESRKLLEQCAKLRRQSQAMVDGHGHGEKQVMNVLDLMEKMQRRWRAASHENAQLREQNGRLKRQIENFETALAEARDENQRLNSQHASDQELIAGLQRELDQYKERFKRARTELQNAAPSLIPSICRQNHHQGGESRKIGQKRRSTSLTSRIPEGKRTKNHHHHFDGQQQFGDNAEAVENGGGQNQQEKTSAESSIDSTASRVRRRRMFGSNTETEEDIGDDGGEAAETQKIGKFHGDAYFPPLNAGNFGRRFGLGPLISLSNSNGGLISQNGGGGRRQQQKIQQQRENKNTLTPLRTAAENDGMLLTLISSSRTGPNSPMQPPAPPPSTTTSVASAFNSQSPFSRPLLTPFYTSTMASGRPISQRQQPPSRKLLLDPLFVPLGAAVNSNSSNTNPRPAAAAQKSPTSPQSRQILRNNHVTPVSSRPRRIPVRIVETPMGASSRRCALN